MAAFKQYLKKKTKRLHETKENLETLLSRLVFLIRCKRKPNITQSTPQKKMYSQSSTGKVSKKQVMQPQYSVDGGKVKR